VLSEQHLGPDFGALFFITACMKRLPALMHSKEPGSGSIALAIGVMSGDRYERLFAATERDIPGVGLNWKWLAITLRKSLCNVTEIIAEGSDPPRLVRLIQIKVPIYQPCHKFIEGKFLL
jgi:hypothetical protein